MTVLHAGLNIDILTKYMNVCISCGENDSTTIYRSNSALSLQVNADIICQRIIAQQYYCSSTLVDISTNL